MLNVLVKATLFLVGAVLVLSVLAISYSKLTHLHKKGEVITKENLKAPKKDYKFKEDK